MDTNAESAESSCDSSAPSDNGEEEPDSDATTLADMPEEAGNQPGDMEFISKCVKYMGLLDAALRVASVDLQSCFGTAPMLVDGDALFREVGWDPYTDWSCGGQLLHCVYLAEKIFAGLVERGVQLHLFFFAAELNFLAPRQRLLWLLLCEHFRRAEGQVNGIRHHLFEGSWLDNAGALLSLARATNPSCVLTDFARAAPPLGADDVTLSDLSQVRSCGFVHWLHCKELRAVDLEGLKTDGPRIRASTLELRVPFSVPLRLLSIRCANSTPPEASLCLEPDASLRVSVGLHALGCLSPGQASNEDPTRGLCAVFCACLALMEVLPLEMRSVSRLQPLPDSLDFLNFVSRLQEGMQQALVCLGKAGPAWDSTLADIFDGRLLWALTSKCVRGTIVSGDGDLTLSSHSLEFTEGLWHKLHAGNLNDAFQSLEHSETLPDKSPAKATETDSEPQVADLLPVPWVSQALGHGATFACGSDPQRPFAPHHYHSCAPLDAAEPDAFATESSAPVRNLRVENEGRLQDILQTLQPDCRVEFPRKGKMERWMRQIRARGVVFTLAHFTDPTRADAPVTSLSALKELLGPMPRFPIVLSFLMDMSDRYKVKKAQLVAARDQKFLESLLQGSPAPRQTISEKTAPAQLQALRAAAEARLTERPGLGTAPRGTKRFVGSVERVKQQALAAQQKKSAKQSLEQVKSIKEQFKNLSSGLKAKEVATLLKRLRRWWEEDSKDAFFEAAKLCTKACPELDESLPQEKSRRKRSFQMLQEVLRACGGPETLQGTELLEKLQKLAQKHLKMPALAVALGASPKAQSKRTPASISGVDPEACAFRFQLRACPEHLARPVGAADSRVQGFKPDLWQSTLLDVVDANQSALVQAPTASGKTFIGFYAMERVLRQGDEGVLVYVCPTKALANQVHAEIQARFSKTYKDGRPFCGIFTRDSRSERCQECQILVTVPQCLIIYMLSPTAKGHGWLERLQYAIVDEVHCLGGEDGSVWEQVLSLLPCPVLALSATLGQGEAFTAWLKDLEAQRGRDLHVVKHFGRFNDLQTWVFDGEGLQHLHPFFALQPLVSAGAPRPNSLHLIPEDALQLYDALGAPQDLAPHAVFDKAWDLGMTEARAWAERVAERFDQASCREQVVQEVAKEAVTAFQQVDAALKTSEEFQYLLENIGALVQELQTADMLPAICFHNGRQGCEKLAMRLGLGLANQEKRWREVNQVDAKLEQLRNRLGAVQASLARVEQLQASGEGGTIKVSGGEMDMIEMEKGIMSEIYRLQAIPREFTWTPAGQQQLTPSYVDEELPRFHHFDHRNPLHQLLLRGIGVHHAGLAAPYRQLVERLFRMQRLGIVVSTSTLALGINMPSKTSVFAGASVYLTPMQFQQEAGRAGRRGFDLRGHTVFFGVRSKEVQQLLVGELPVMQGNEPLTASLALCLATKAQILPTTASAVAGAAGRALCPFACQGASSRAQRANMLCFLMRQLFHEGFLGASGVTDFAGFVAHVWWQEPGNFAFVALLQERGLLTKLCQGPREHLVAVLCHFFNRKQLEGWQCRKKTRPKTSLVVLPPLPPELQMLLRTHTLRTLQLAVAQLRMVVPQLGPGDTLPLTRARPCVVGSGAKSGNDLRSPFVALSRGDDDFGSISELCATAREGLRLDPSMFPAVDDTDEPMLNAYLLDFYRHGQLPALVRHNKIPETDVWKLLEDFMFVLRALASAAKHRHARAQQKGNALELGETDVVSTFATISVEFESIFRARGGQNHTA